MKRRDFLLGCGLSAMGALMHDVSIAQLAETWSDGFARALASNPDLGGYKGVAPDTALSSHVNFEGHLPVGLRGTLYRNGPALHEFGGLRYHHWFDGDGMVQAFSFTDQGLDHIGRLVLTEKLAAEIKAGRRTRSTFGTAIAGAAPTTGPDAGNVANTSILPFGPELLALWEGGSAYSLDPKTLATLGPKTWRPDLNGVPFSAHPKIDTTGGLWNFGLDTISSTLVLYQISNLGQLVRAQAHQIPGMTMVHDFVVTANHLVFLLPPFRFSREKLLAGQSFLDCHEWLATSPLRVLVIDKSDLATRKMFELPTGFVFHFGNAWEDDAGIIRFDYVRADDPSNMTSAFKDLMRGVISQGAAAQSTFVTIDMRGNRISQETASIGVEFPRVDPRSVGEKYQNLYLAASMGGAPHRRGFNGVRRLDTVSGRLDDFCYGDNFLVEEHIVVPNPGSRQRGDGWVVGTALDVMSSRTTLSVFDALHLSAGPIARATLPYALPLGLHGNFMAA